MRLSQLVRARIAIADLLDVIAWDNRDIADHWVHAYRPLRTAMRRVGAASFPNDSISSNIAHVFDVGEVDAASTIIN